MTFDFTTIYDREASFSVKYTGRLTKFGTQDLLPLWVADMDFASPPCVTQALLERISHPLYGYTTPPQGLKASLIAWANRRYNAPLYPEELITAPGVVPTLFACVLALTQPGDRVIIQPPVYPPFAQAITASQRHIAPNPLRLDHGRYHIDFDHLETLMRQGAKLMLLCSPHNPVGRVWNHHELITLASLASRYGVVILSDEIHADILAPHATFQTFATIGDRALTLVAYAPSKTFNIPGLGLSFVWSGSTNLLQAVEKSFASLHIANPTNPLSLTACQAAYEGGEPWLEALLATLTDHEHFIRDKLAPTPIVPFVRDGSYLLWLDCRALGYNDRDLRHFFTHKAKVGLNAGREFGEGGEGFMRLNFATPRPILEDALHRIIVSLDTAGGQGV